MLELVISVLMVLILMEKKQILKIQPDRLLMQAHTKFFTALLVQKLE